MKTQNGDKKIAKENIQEPSETNALQKNTLFSLHKIVINRRLMKLSVYLANQFNLHNRL